MVAQRDCRRVHPQSRRPVWRVFCRRRLLPVRIVGVVAGVGRAGVAVEKFPPAAFARQSSVQCETGRSGVDGVAFGQSGFGICLVAAAARRFPAHRGGRSGRFADWQHIQSFARQRRQFPGDAGHRIAGFFLCRADFLAGYAGKHRQQAGMAVGKNHPPPFALHQRPA